MDQWVYISLIALALSVCAAVYFFSFKPLPSAPETAGQKLAAFLWMYVSAFIVTTIAWGLVDAWWNGYCLAC